MRSYFLVFLFSIPLLNGCKKEAISPFDSNTADKVVVIEEFTGVRCPNCPDGAKTLMDLKDVYGNNMVVVALHTPFLGSPFPNSKFNFLTDEEEKIENYIGPKGKPNIAVNRTLFEGEELIALTFGSDWDKRIAKSLEGSAPLHLVIENTFLQEERKLVSKISINPQSDLNGEFKLTVYLTESGIVDLQAENGTNPNYIHNHVLRTVLSTTLGDDLPANLASNQLIERTFEFTLPNEEGWWIPKNCNVVAFVAEIDGDAGSKEVLQAGEKAVIDK